MVRTAATGSRHLRQRNQQGCKPASALAVAGTVRYDFGCTDRCRTAQNIHRTLETAAGSRSMPGCKALSDLEQTRACSWTGLLLQLRQLPNSKTVFALQEAAELVERKAADQKCMILGLR